MASAGRPGRGRRQRRHDIADDARQLVVRAQALVAVLVAAAVPPLAAAQQQQVPQGGGGPRLPSSDIEAALALNATTVELVPGATYEFASPLTITMGSPAGGGQQQQQASGVALVGRGNTFVCSGSAGGTAVSVVNASLSVTGVTFVGCTGTALRVQGGGAGATLRLVDCSFVGNVGDGGVAVSGLAGWWAPAAIGVYRDGGGRPACTQPCGGLQVTACRQVRTCVACLVATHAAAA